MVMNGELTHLDATAQAALVRKGTVTPLQRVDAAIARHLVLLGLVRERGRCPRLRKRERYIPE